MTWNLVLAAAASKTIKRAPPKDQKRLLAVLRAMQQDCPYHDRDHAFDALGATAKRWGARDVVTAPHAPWQNPFVERFVGSARRECFDHVIAFNEAGVRKLMRHYGSYYERPRLTWRWIKTRPFPVRSAAR